MDTIFAFLQDYYYLIILCLFIIILCLELCILLIRKKDPNILSGINGIVPGLVAEAESKFGGSTGPTKFQYVLQSVHDYLCHVYSITDVTVYDRYIKAKIEEILSTPHKKEKING